MFLAEPTIFGVIDFYGIELYHPISENHLRRRVWAYFEMRLAFTVALFNLLQQWRGLDFDEHGVSHFSLAEFS